MKYIFFKRRESKEIAENRKVLTIKQIQAFSIRLFGNRDGFYNICHD